MNLALAPSAIRASGIARTRSAVAVLIFGLGLLYGVGFSTLSLAHNAAHDTRHATGFPCH